MNTASPVFLTFDDGPDREWTPRILDELARAQVQATFFMIGTAAVREPALVRRIASEGHAIGNHTASHRHPWAMRTSAARQEVQEGSRMIAGILGQPPRFFRAPHGRERACMTDEATRCGQQLVRWDLSAVDWGPLGRADRIAARLQRTAADDIVLMHDGRNRHNRPDELLRVLPSFLQELANRGLRARPLCERESHAMAA